MLSTQQLDQYKPWLISVAKTGSSSLPWINRPRDTDYIICVRDRSNPKAIFGLHKLKPENECWLIDSLDNPTIRIYAYQYHFLEPVYGDIFQNFDIFQRSKEYKKRMIDYSLHHENDLKLKQWYHILTGIYMLQNGEYNLTDEQIKNVRLCHSRQMTQEIYDYIQQQLAIFKQELDVEE